MTLMPKARLFVNLRAHRWIVTVLDRLMVFEPSTGTQIGLVSIPSSDSLDTVISPDGNYAYVPSFGDGKIFVVDMTTKALASGINPINVGGNMEGWGLSIVCTPLEIAYPPCRRRHFQVASEVCQVVVEHQLGHCN